MKCGTNKGLSRWLIVVVFFMSCTPDDFSKLSTSNWQPELAVPLINSRFDASRVLQKAEENGFIAPDSQNVVTLGFSGELFNVGASELIELQDVPFDLLLLSGKLQFPAQGMQIHHLNMQSGMLDVHLEHLNNQNVIVQLTIPGAKLGGQVFSNTINLNAAGSAPVVFTTSYDLSGYEFDMTGNGSESNVIEINYTSTSASGGQPLPLSTFNILFRDLVFEYIDGQMGEIDLGNYGDTLILNLYKNFKSGSVFLDNPSMKLTFKNGFGMPVSARINKFVSEGSGKTLALAGSVVGSQLPIKAATSQGQIMTSEIAVNSANSNLRNLIALSPNEIEYEFGLKANEGGGTGSLNFVAANSRLEGLIDLNLPLSGRIDSVVIEDFYEFETTDLKNALWARFKLWTVNTFPLGVYFQVYFIDTDGNTIDSLVSDNSIILKEALTDSQGFSTGGAIEESYFDVSEKRFLDIKNRAKRFKVRAMLLTDQSDTKSVKISPDDYFLIKLGMIAKLKVEN